MQHSSYIITHPYSFSKIESKSRIDELKEVGECCHGPGDGRSVGLLLKAQFYFIHAPATASHSSLATLYTREDCHLPSISKIQHLLSTYSKSNKFFKLRPITAELVRRQS